MYDLIDRPIDALPAFERDMLDTTRRWVHAFSMAGAAPRPMPDDALFDVMHALNDGSAGDLVIQRPCYATVEETEAVILSLWRMVWQDRLAAARVLAGALVDDRHVPVLIAGMVRVVAGR